VDEESWYEEQLYFLLERMHSLHIRDAQSVQRISATRPSTRRELFRRVSLGVNFINTHYSEQITLDHIAAAALLSRFHCLRVFKEAYGITPIAFLNQRRVKAASRLLHSGQHSVSEVARLAGFRNRITLFRQITRARGISPKKVQLEFTPETST
jgi:AraC family transcriptional regulator